MRATCSAALLLVLVSQVTAFAYKPESPEVQAIVARGIKFIEDATLGDGDSIGKQGQFNKTGGTCLAALAMYKHYGTTKHPLIDAAVAKCKALCRDRAAYGSSHDGSNYSLGIAIIFLAEIDPVEYRPELEVLLRELMRRQQPGGGWSYPDHKTGDTSQTQYAVLGSWMAKRQNIDLVTQDSVEKVCNWLLRTQAPNGSWGYQGRDPGNFQRVNQDKQTLSLAAAGLGSTYVCAELLGFIQDPSERRDNSGVPSALREVGAKKSTGPITDKVDRAAITRAIGDGNGWFGKNFNIRAQEYQHYYMYALERYMSFRELAERSKNEEPAWYNQGVEYLQRTQEKDGSWKSSEAGHVVDSSFAVLFLLRSTKKSIKRIVEESGTTRGGKSLPSDLSTIMVDGRGNVVDAKATPAIEILLAELEKDDTELNTDIPSQLTLSNDPNKRAAELARLRRMLMSGKYQARLAAAKTLGRDRDLAHVPVLIFALSDPDHRVVRSARDGLRFISRKFGGFGLPEKPNRSQYLAAQKQWKDWYLSVQPDGAIIE